MVFFTTVPVGSLGHKYHGQHTKHKCLDQTNEQLKHVDHGRHKNRNHSGDQATNTTPANIYQTTEKQTKGSWQTQRSSREPTIMSMTPKNGFLKRVVINEFAEVRPPWARTPMIWVINTEINASAAVKFRSVERPRTNGVKTYPFTFHFFRSTVNQLPPKPEWHDRSPAT